MPRHQRFGLIALVGVGISALFVWLAVRHLDVKAIAALLRHATWFPWVPLAAVFYLVGHGVRGQRLRVLLRRQAQLQLPTASNVVVVGYASNNVLPARLGELVRNGASHPERVRHPGQAPRERRLAAEELLELRLVQLPR